MVEQRYRKSPDIVFRSIAHEVILVPIRHNAADLQSIYTLNEVGARIWQLIDGQKSTAQIIDVIVDEFKVTYQAAEKDVGEFLSKLVSIEAINLS